MKVFIIKGIVLISIISLSVWIPGLFDNITHSNNLNILRIKNSRHFQELDYLFIGNSYTYSAINPQFFDSLNYKTYNLGIATAGACYYELIIDDYLKQAASFPKNIIVLISPMTFSDKSDSWEAYPIHRHLNKPLSNKYILEKYKIGIGRYLKLLRKSSINGWKNVFKSLFSIDFEADGDGKTYKGFEFVDDVYSQETYDKTLNLYLSLLKDKFPLEKLEYLINVAEGYKAQGINVIFHEIPSFKLHSLQRNI